MIFAGFFYPSPLTLCINCSLFTYTVYVVGPNVSDVLGFVSLGPFRCARFIFVLCITVCCMHDCLGL